jgi:hypothetical protein
MKRGTVQEGRWLKKPSAFSAWEFRTTVAVYRAAIETRCTKLHEKAFGFFSMGVSYHSGCFQSNGAEIYPTEALFLFFLLYI